MSMGLYNSLINLFSEPLWDMAVLPFSKQFHLHDPQMSSKDLLIVIFDSGMLSIIKFCNEINRFFSIKNFPLSNPGNKIDKLRRIMLAADSSGCYIAAIAYEDQLALFSVSMTGSDVIDKVQTTILSCIF